MLITATINIGGSGADPSSLSVNEIASPSAFDWKSLLLEILMAWLASQKK